MSKSFAKPTLVSSAIFAFSLSGAVPVHAQVSDSRSVNRVVEVQIPAGPLMESLKRVESLFGVTVRVPETLPAGRMAPSVSGGLTARQVLERLVQGSELHVADVEGQGFRLLPSGPSDGDVATLAPVLVLGRSAEPGVQRLESEDVRSTVRSDLAETLSVIPSVRVSDSASSSLQQSDLKPAEFSIRGAAPYQNNIMLDGASIDSFLDPAYGRSAGSQVPSRTQVEGHSQALFIDPDFLSSVEVIDINASAREGGFTGGVVKSQTRSYSGEDEFEISHRRTSGDWTEFHVDEDQEDEFGAGAGNYPTGTPGEYQPEFRKSETSLSGATRVGNIGVFAGYSEKRSHTRQKQFAATDIDYFLETGLIFKAEGPKSLDHHSRFFTVRADALETAYDLSASLSYSDYSEDSFLINYLGSDFHRDTEGLNLSVNYGQYLGETRLDANVSAGRSTNERETQRDYLYNYTGRNFYTEGAFIGNYGNLANTQHTLGTDIELSTPLGVASSVVNYGLELKWAHYEQHRETPYTERTYQPPDASAIGVYGVPYEDHHLYEEVIYRQGDISFTNLNAALFAELEGDYGRFFWRPGVRVERDGWLGNTNIAPRLMAGLHLDDAERYEVRVGANRYYGKSFLTYRLREKERDLRSKRQRTAPYDPSAPFVDVAPEDEWTYRHLDTPYDDELSAGVYGPFLAGQFGLQAVLRKGHDQIRTKTDPDTDIDWYANSGASETRQVDLYWRSHAMRWGYSSWHVNASMSWMDKETDADYGDGSGGYQSALDPDEDVIFKGSRIARRELPADDFATPVTANLDVVTGLFDHRVTMVNGLAFTNGYRYLERTGEDPATGLDEYEIEDQGSTIRWDLSVEANLLGGKSSPYLKVDVINVTDNDNVISSESGIQLYGLGRQYWLEMGYRF